MPIEREYHKPELGDYSDLEGQAREEAGAQFNTYLNNLDQSAKLNPLDALKMFRKATKELFAKFF